MINLYTMNTLLDLTSGIILVYFFNKTMPSKIKKYNKGYTIIMVIFYFLIKSKICNQTSINLQYSQIVLFTLICYILVLIYPVLFRRGRRAEKVFLSSFYIAIVVTTSFIIYIMLSELFDIKFSDVIFETNYIGSIIILVNRLAQFIIVSISLNNMTFIKYIQDKTLYVCGASFIFNNILVMIVDRELLNNTYTINISIIIFLFSFFIMQILLIYVLNIFSKEMEEKYILKMNLDRKIHDEEIKNMYTEMIGWKHDFKNHMNMILGLLQVGKKEDAISYINEIDNIITELDKNIYTNNIAINSILISKVKLANEKNIKVNLDLKIDSEIKISNVDICVIIGNLLDNSIEACNFINGYKFIDLKIISINNKLVINISNNTNGYIDEVDGKFLTTKKNDMHGIGLIQIDNIIKKYKGYVNRKHENNIFTTYIMIQYKY